MAENNQLRPIEEVTFILSNLSRKRSIETKKRIQDVSSLIAILTLTALYYRGYTYRIRENCCDKKLFEHKQYSEDSQRETIIALTQDDCGQLELITVHSMTMGR